MREIVVVMVAGATCAIQFAEHCYPLSLPSLFSYLSATLRPVKTRSRETQWGIISYADHVTFGVENQHTSGQLFSSSSPFFLWHCWKQVRPHPARAPRVILVCSRLFFFLEAKLFFVCANFVPSTSKKKSGRIYRLYSHAGQLTIRNTRPNPNQKLQSKNKKTNQSGKEK